MKEYKYFTFRNFVVLNVTDDFNFVDIVDFWMQAKILEIQQTGMDGRTIEGGFALPLSDADIQVLRTKLTPEVFEKSLQELLLLMEEGLIVIGDSNDFIEKTSYGHFAITVPEGTIYDAIQAARDDFAKDKDGWFESTWMIQATTKGWEWANRIDGEIPTEEFRKEWADFYGE
jgi:hypothetical protein